jgi:hypothetical protein
LSGLSADDNRFHPSTLGIALVEGYDSMGYELSKPHLRAQTEVRTAGRISMTVLSGWQAN